MMSERLHITQSEQDLLLAIRMVRFGELSDVEVIAEDPNIPTDLTARQAGLIRLIRDGNQYFSRIVVHEGDPQQVEVPGEIRGFKATLRIRI